MASKYEKGIIGNDEPMEKEPVDCPRIWKVLGLLGLIWLAWMHLDFPQPTHHHCHGKYPGESIHWKPCGTIKDRRLECSSIDVPIDQFNKSESDKTFKIPIVRLRSEKATKNLLLNPGGPGGSGFSLIQRRGEQLSTIVGDGFHLVSFDPRGVNSSSPQATCYPDEETRKRTEDVSEANIIHESAKIYAWTQNFVRACEDTMGEHGKYINTPQTAADMNSILDALGQEDMYYWGFSYGTLLGQTYATLFPERSHRVIIDGVVNQFDWYGQRVDLEDLTDTEKVLDGFLKECVKAGDNCSMSTLATSWEGLKEKFVSFMDGIEAQPLSVYLNNTSYGLLTYQKLWYGALFPTLYKPSNWFNFASTIGSLMKGNATDAFLQYGLDDLPTDDSFYTISHNDGKSGPKHWPQDLGSFLDLLSPLLNSSLFARDDSAFYFAKAQWSIPHTHDYVPKRGVKTKHPLLILTTTYDPVCPLISAKAARGAFEESRIVEVEGYGHCSIAVPSQCIAKHVRSFLYDGELPEDDIKCQVDGPYFVNPDEDKNALAQQYFDGAQEQELYLAQLELADALEWRTS